MKLHEIWRYPVKSLTGAKMARTVLNPSQGLPHDRRWALARPGSDAAQAPGWQSKSQFFVLVREHALAQLKCRFDDVTGRFCFDAPNGLHAEGTLTTPEGRAAIAAGVAKHLGLAPDDAPVMVEAGEIGYFDTTKGPVSLLNLASLRALEEAIGQPLDPARFRMNFLIEGAEPWSEAGWIGKRIQVGTAVLRVTEPTGRCKATHVNPDTGETDAKILHALKDNFDHTQMGVYAIVEDGGPVEAGDEVRVLDAD